MTEASTRLSILLDRIAVDAQLNLQEEVERLLISPEPISKSAMTKEAKLIEFISY